MRKLLFPLAIVLLLCSANAYAITVNIKGPKHIVATESTIYEVVINPNDKIEKGKGDIKSIKYHWTIKGDGVSRHTADSGWGNKDSIKVIASEKPETKGTIVCIVKVEFEKGPSEENSAELTFTVMPKR